MAIQFEEIVNPLIILITVPLASVGGIFMLYITNTGSNLLYSSWHAYAYRLDYQAWYFTNRNLYSSSPSRYGLKESYYRSRPVGALGPLS